MDKTEWGFIRGITECVEMLDTLDVDEGMIHSSCRLGRPQENAVRRVLGEILARGNARELDGFCAALTEIVAIADEHRAHQRMLSVYADRRADVAKRWLKRATQRAVARELGQ